VDRDAERVALLALALVPGLGPRRVRTLRRAFGSAQSAMLAARRGDSWPPLPGLGRAAVARLAARASSDEAEHELRRLSRLGAGIVTDHDAGFPHGWEAFDDLPPLLFVRGRWPTGLERWPPSAVAVVGSRRASRAALAFTHDLGHALAGAGAVVVSGLALGIDGAAHEGALATGSAGAGTVAVLASGVDRPTPTEHQRLSRAIVAAGGALVSEARVGAVPGAHAFPRRNRLIAALARAVIVVEAGPASGANLTAGHAAAYGREVLVVTARPWDDTMAGNLALLRDGAAPVYGVEDALALLGLDPPHAPSPGTLPTLAEPAAWAYELLGGGARTADTVVAASGRPAAEVLAALERLVAAGVVDRDRGGGYRRRGAHGA
jgi:DNA processing protein